MARFGPALLLAGGLLFGAYATNCGRDGAYRMAYHPDPVVNTLGSRLPELYAPNTTGRNIGIGLGLAGIVAALSERRRR